ncbi:MAG TPA: NADPH-dependent FMN reductase [Bacteriovoracaceae bacterium]|nr:NADPH-dependent FMN reductase [Bacteriovoracaceae bacterium]
MDAVKVLTLIGGISCHSLNKKLFNSILDLSFRDYEFESFDISRLPFFSQDLELDPPDSVIDFKDQIRQCEAVLFITPEYNRSFPGVLKNAVDWGSRPLGQNLWNNKPAAVMGASLGNIDTFGAQHHLRQVLAYLNLRVMGQPEFYFNGSRAFNEGGELVDTNTRKQLKAFFSAFKDWCDHLDIRHPVVNQEIRLDRSRVNETH